MAMIVDRSVQGRQKRNPDLFLSHSSRDKAFVRRLAEDLSFLEVDTWLDEWELQAGDSLIGVIGTALEQSKYIAVVLGDNYADSRWAQDELRQALARERRADSNVVLPLLCGEAIMPYFLEDKMYLDLRGEEYFNGLVRLAGIVHSVSRQRIEDAIRWVWPRKISDCIQTLRHFGIEPYVVLDADDWKEIASAGGKIEGDRIRFAPETVAEHPSTSIRIKHLMTRLIDEVWTGYHY
jgi:hypothetical protein